MAGFVETMITSAAEAKARSDIERPIAVSMANEHNALGFRNFAATVKEVYNGNFDQAISDYERYCQASGKS